MSLFGSLADVAIVDLLQFVHLSGRSGTLYLERDDEQAHISFHRGRIVSAWSPTSPRVSDLLIAAGQLDHDRLAATLARQGAEPLGTALVSSGVVSADALREAITQKVERTVFDLIEWSRGSFRFVMDDIRGDQEISLAPGDVIPQLEINTQFVLMEALRLFDERGQRDQPPRPVATAPAAPTTTAPSITLAADASVQIVTPDRPLSAQLAKLFGSDVIVRDVPVRDAGIPAPGEAPPIVIVDARPGGVAASVLGRLRDQHPRALFVAVIAPSSDPSTFYAAGAAAVLPPDAAMIRSCVITLLAARSALPHQEAELRSGLARLRRVLGDIRGGLLSATMSLNLMTIVADSVERAVLFVVQRGKLVGLGAFGTRNDGRPLAATTQGLALALDREGPVGASIADGRARVIEMASPDVPVELRDAIDCPRTGQAVLFPVLGTRRVIAMIYADNGPHLRSIEDVEIVEIATAQVGLAFENELLRRQLEKPGIPNVTLANGVR